MRVNRRLYFKRKLTLRCFIPIILILIISSYTVYLLLPPSVSINLNSIHRNIRFTSKTVYFLDGVAYDYYSVDELRTPSQAGLQWNTFPLPNEKIPPNIIPWIPPNYMHNRTSSVNRIVSPQTRTNLSFIDHIYIATAPALNDRQDNLKRSFARYQITDYEWRMKWTRESCNSVKNKEEVDRKLNLEIKESISERKPHRQCAIAMEHIDIWHDIVARNSSLSLILEDDAVFVPNFREKLERTIYTTVRTGALNIGGLSNCVSNGSQLSMDRNEWYQQDPMIVIGSCVQVHDDHFPRNQRDASPMLSTHKDRAGRCSHAYLLTACSAQAIIRQIAAATTAVLDIDLFLDKQVSRSPTIQSFWLDPPIVYQGNQIYDLDGIPSFKKKTH